MARLAAYEEAIALLRRGQALLRAPPDSPERDRQELALLFERTPALDFAKGYLAPETASLDDRAEELAMRVGDPFQLIRTRIRRVGLLHARAEYEQALMVSERDLPQAVIDADPWLACMCHVQRGLIFHRIGVPSRARSHFEAALRLYHPRSFNPVAGLLGSRLWHPVPWIAGCLPVATWLPRSGLGSNAGDYRRGTGVQQSRD